MKLFVVCCRIPGASEITHTESDITNPQNLLMSDATALYIVKDYLNNPTVTRLTGTDKICQPKPETITNLCFQNLVSFTQYGSSILAVDAAKRCVYVIYNRDTVDGFIGQCGDSVNLDKPRSIVNGIKPGQYYLTDEGANSLLLIDEIDRTITTVLKNNGKVLVKPRGLTFNDGYLYALIPCLK